MQKRSRGRQAGDSAATAEIEQRGRRCIPIVRGVAGGGQYFKRYRVMPQLQFIMSSRAR